MEEVIDERVKAQYNILKRLGRGAYGVVWKAKNKITGQKVALKKIFDAFQNKQDAQRTLREVLFLIQISLNPHENIIKLNRINTVSKSDLYLEFELIESDLDWAINNYMLHPIHIKFITYQILLALYYLNSGGLIHRDIKPSNILISSDCKIKLCDFGLARLLSDSPEEKHDECGDSLLLTNYVATRWYRPMEILLGASYSFSADIWSVGCVLGEMISSQPLFPGKSSLDQIQTVIAILGIPTINDINSLDSDMAEIIVRNVITNPSFKRKRNENRTTLKKLKNDSQMFDLFLKMLKYNPNERISVIDALEHPYFDSIRNKEDFKITKKHFKIPKNVINMETPMEFQKYLSNFVRRLSKRLRSNQSLQPTTI